MKKRKILFILLISLLVFSFLSCRDTMPLDYRRSAFVAEIRYESGGESFCAEVSVGAPPSDTTVERDIKMRFTAPESLVGLCAERKNGISKVTLGSAEIESESAAQSFLRVAELLIFDGNLKFIEKYEENGLLFYRAEISGADKTVSLLLDNNGAPKRVSYCDLSITVIRFQ